MVANEPGSDGANQDNAQHGLLPLYLNNATLQDIQMNTTDGEAKRYGTVTKSFIIKDLSSNGRGSDFHAAGAYINEYDGEQLILVSAEQITAATNDDYNYYLTVTAEAYDDQLTEMEYYNENYGGKQHGDDEGEEEKQQDDDSPDANKENDVAATADVGRTISGDDSNDELHHQYSDDDAMEEQDEYNDDDINSRSRSTSKRRSSRSKSSSGRRTTMTSSLGARSKQKHANDAQLYEDLDAIPQPVTNTRPKISYIIQQPRQKFNKLISEFDDMNATTNEKLHLSVQNSSTCVGHTLKRHILEGGFQAAAVQTHTGTQTSYTAKYNQAIQYQSTVYTAEQRAQLLQSNAFLKFVADMTRPLHLALYSNECLDIFKNEFASLISLVDDDEESANGAGMSGSYSSKNDSMLEIYHTYHHLVFSKNRSVSDVHWIQSRPAGSIDTHGNKLTTLQRKQQAILAFSCTQSQLYDQWIDVAGRPQTTYILFYNLIDLLQPLQVLEIPGNVTCFSINPNESDLIVAGMSNGQICYWDLREHRRKLQWSQADKSMSVKDNRRTGSINSGTAISGALEASASTNDSQAQIAPIVPTLLTSLDKAHTRPITALQWLSPEQQVNKKGEVIGTLNSEEGEHVSSQFISVAADGKIMFWDFQQKTTEPKMQQPSASNQSATTSGSVSVSTLHRPTGTAAAPSEAATSAAQPANITTTTTTHYEDIKWYPLATLPLLRGDTHVANISKLLLSGSTQLLATTEEGELMFVDWLHTVAASSSSEDGASAHPVSTKPSHIAILNGSAHHSTVQQIIRSPHDPTLVATVGDWQLKLWRDHRNGEPLQPIWQASSSTESVTAVSWSPSRPGVIVVGKHDGSVDVYDLIDSAHKPVLTSMTGFSESITSISFWHSTSQQSQYLAVGDSGGKVHVMEVPRSLRRKVTGEDQLVAMLFQREVQKQQYAEQQRKHHHNRSLPTTHNTTAANHMATADKHATAATAQGSTPNKDKPSSADTNESSERDTIEKEYQALLKQYITQHPTQATALEAR